LSAFAFLHSQDQELTLSAYRASSAARTAVVLPDHNPQPAL
jgi:hypothetical protein